MWHSPKFIPYSCPDGFADTPDFRYSFGFSTFRYGEETIMRTRMFIFVSLLLVLSLTACSKKSDSAANTADQNTADQNTAAQGGQNEGGSTGPAGRRGASEAQPVVVPAGTSLTVRLGESVGSKISSPGQSFSATLSNPIEVGGVVVVPAGAAVQGTVTDAKPLGKFKGGASLSLALNSITINGRTHAIETSSVMRAEKGKGKRTAVVTGGGAALGALIGGLAGGGKGAAIGAVAGGGAGAAGSALTGNKDIVLPAESALTFKLRSPLEVR